MPDSRHDLLRFQFDLTWSLFELHLDLLTAADFLWEPAEHCWTMRRGDGGWVPDWADTEPDPIPVPTIGWLSWHIGWWWSVTVDHAEGRTPMARTEICWPGPGSPAVEWLRNLRVRWLAVLDALTESKMDEPAPFPWPEGSQHTVGHMAAWVNAELMKNAAEIGQLRVQRAVAISPR